MHPVTTRRAPGRRASPSASTVSIDSWRAASMKAHVLTTTTSASSGPAAGTSPSASIVPVSLSESTWFFGQPRVSTQTESGTDFKLPVALTSTYGDDRDDQPHHRSEHRQGA